MQLPPPCQGLLPAAGLCGKESEAGSSTEALWGGVLCVAFTTGFLAVKANRILFVKGWAKVTQRTSKSCHAAEDKFAYQQAVSTKQCDCLSKEEDGFCLAACNIIRF